jgi:hypothetical protein
VNSEPAGILLIRVWLEETSGEPVRARIRASIGFPPAFESTQAVAGVDRVLEAVRAWLEEILAASRG